jgi:hypothetical protein
LGRNILPQASKKAKIAGNNIALKRHLLKLRFNRLRAIAGSHIRCAKVFRKAISSHLSPTTKSKAR